tara:strand:- start:1671 stop:1859 length:189 start_codon:yes stop_codon:yes gene_type:complete
VKLRSDDWITALYFQQMVIKNSKEKNNDQHARIERSTQKSSERNIGLPKKLQSYKTSNEDER